MARKPQKGPTDAELEILHILWEHGKATVREVHGRLAQDRDTGYTTVLKLMQIMTEKGLIVRDENVRPQIYRAAKTLRSTQKQILGDMLDRVFRGSPGNMVLQALSTKKTTKEERERIRELLDQLEDDHDR